MENPTPTQQDIAEAIKAGLDQMDAEATVEQVQESVQKKLEDPFPGEEFKVQVEGKSKVQDAANQCKDCSDPNCPGRILIALGTLSKEQEAAIEMVMEMATNRIKAQEKMLEQLQDALIGRDRKVGELSRSLAAEKAQNAELVDAVARLQRDNKRLIKVTLALAKK